MYQQSHSCDTEAEPLYLYGKGGYHPVHLGDSLKDGRYKILHKLGWGSYSTVWAARDQRENMYVALKISTSEQETPNRELSALQAIATAQSYESDKPGIAHIMTMQDHFQLNGPNGSHDCYVLELLGPNVADYVDVHFEDNRLPGKLARNIAKQALLGLSYLHEQGIGHADLHTRNLAFTIPSMHALQEEEFVQKLGRPEKSPVRRTDQQPLEPSTPSYLVKPASFSMDSMSSPDSVKIIDFGESFRSSENPKEFHTPLPLRAPEIIFNDKVDYRMDLWSMGCMLFELIVGQPPFDSILTTPPILVSQMLEMTGDQLPERWQAPWRAMKSDSPSEDLVYSLQGWLEELYFDGQKSEDLSREDILRAGAIIGSMLRFEPSARALPKDTLKGSWFRGD